MTLTGQRFDEYASRETEVFAHFLDNFDQKPGFKGIKEALNRYEPHPGGIEDYDIRCETERGYITFDIQESENFSTYGDLRIDYVSSFRPVSRRFYNISQFKQALDSQRVTVDTWGKVVDPKAEFLVVEFHNGKTQWQIYNLRELHKLLPELETIGQFRTNIKYGEGWGSAFLAVRETHPTLQGVKPPTLEDILSRAAPRP